MRKRGRPKDVSFRRIRSIRLAAGVIGLVWVGISLLYMSKADPISAMLMLMATYLFSVFTLVAMPSSPKASLIGSNPLIFANGFGPAYFGQLSAWFSVVMALGIFAIMLMCVRG